MNKRIRKKHQNERNDNNMTNATLPNDGIDRSVYEEPYVIQEGCLCEEVMTKTGTAYLKLADYVPVLRKEITIDDGIELKKQFLISAKHTSGISLPEVCISAEEMQNMKWPLIKWGALGAAEPRKNVLAKMCHAIMMTKRENITVETVYRQTGWKKVDGKYVFLMPDENSILNVELPGKLSAYGFSHKSAPSDIRSLAQLLEKPFATAKIMHPLLALVFLSPLDSLLKKAGCEPKFVTALVGKTGTRKSTLTAFLLSFFGRFSASNLPHSSNDTANSIIESAYLLKDVLTCVDDFHPAVSYRAQEMNSNLQTICRAYGDRVGRGRLNSSGELKSSRPPTGNCIVTMEFAPELFSSGNARLFAIEITEKDIDLSLLSEYQRLADADVFSCIMQQYLESISQCVNANKKEFTDSIKAGFLNYRLEFSRLLTERHIVFHPRMPEILAELKIGFSCLLTFLLSRQQISAEQVENHMRSFNEMLLQLAAYNSELVTREDPVSLFCEKLKSLLDSGKCFTTVKGEAPSSNTKGYIGMEDQSCYYLIADAVHSAVKSQCSEQGEAFSLTKNQLIKLLCDEHILIKMSGRNTGSVRLNGGRVMNVITLDKKAIVSRLSGAVCPPSTEIG